MTVDKFIADKVLPQFQDVAALLRALMAEHAPNAREMMSYGLPMYIDHSTLAWISPNKQGITFGFTFGREFEDRYGLLKGTGKHALNVKVRSVESANREALRDYILQAVERDKQE